MNRIDDFYRKKEILEHIKKWTNPLSVDVDEDREKVEIGFHSEISQGLKKQEKVNLLCIIRDNLEEELRRYLTQDRSPKVALINKLEEELKELKKGIKKDLGIVKGGD